jgi:uncharacterized membrane protein YedE/YeeE
MSPIKKTVRRKTTSPAVKKTTRTAVRSRKSDVKAVKIEIPVAAPKKDIVKPGVYLGFGVLFGYLIAKAGITDSDNILNMFLVFNKQYRDFHLYGVIGILVLVVTIGVLLLQRTKGKSLLGGKPLEWKPKSFEGERLMGAALFGFGWALSGACPSSAVAQLGEGKIMALFTIAGILVGTWAYRVWAEKK